MMVDERRFCPNCNELLDTDEYCKSCGHKIDEVNMERLQRLNFSYNFFVVALFLLASLVIYVVLVALFEDVLRRYREDTLFGIRFTIFLYALSPMVATLLFAALKIFGRESRG
jgi:predicted nucleic acid-binding Zn ribbon protein